MIVVAGSVSVPPENAEAFMAAAAELSAASRALDGNVDYCISMQASGTFRFFECWENEDAMNAQFAAGPFGAFQAAVGDLGMAGMDGKKYHIASVGPLFG
ncbi:antibiotic biosynthesis monooxygenase [Candidatus Poriferisocius sp.]|uniref:antibiotic biosynthesis monooxygenase n=1 Tax=Candidatus Poriferisocius sp. TaxID=3101276 RepID=UPI003B5C14B1